MVISVGTCSKMWRIKLFFYFWDSNSLTVGWIVAGCSLQKYIRWRFIVVVKYHDGFRFAHIRIECAHWSTPPADGSIATGLSTMWHPPLIPRILKVPGNPGVALTSWEYLQYYPLCHWDELPPGYSRYMSATWVRGVYLLTTQMTLNVSGTWRPCLK